MIRDTSIAVRFKVHGEEAEHLCSYDNADAVLGDSGLKALFDGEFVKTCVIERKGKRLTGLPFMTWELFAKALQPYTTKKGTSWPICIV